MKRTLSQQRFIRSVKRKGAKISDEKERNTFYNTIIRGEGMAGGFGRSSRGHSEYNSSNFSRAKDIEKTLSHHHTYLVNKAKSNALNKAKK